MKITKELIYAIAPAAKPEIVNALVTHQGIMTEYNITSDDDVCYFLGQSATETSGFNRLEENLFYTTTARLRAVWPSRFKTDAAAAPYARNPQKLANLVYGGRLGNLPGTSDGWDFRGSGAKQTTGRYNFTAVEKATGIKCVSMPELLRRFPEALTSACVYWKQNNLARFVRTGDVVGLTKAIQGGSGGLKDRQIYTRRAMEALKIMPPVRNPEANAQAMLRNGSRGAQVTEIQRRLFSLGYESVGNLDGIFGDATEDAVKLFQTANGLVADGVVGPATLKALTAAKAPKPAPAPVPQPKPVPPKPSTGPAAAIVAVIIAAGAAVYAFLKSQGVPLP